MCVCARNENQSWKIKKQTGRMKKKTDTFYRHCLWMEHLSTIELLYFMKFGQNGKRKK